MDRVSEFEWLMFLIKGIARRPIWALLAFTLISLFVWKFTSVNLYDLYMDLQEKKIYRDVEETGGCFEHKIYVWGETLDSLDATSDLWKVESVNGDKNDEKKGKSEGFKVKHLKIVSYLLRKVVDASFEVHPFLISGDLFDYFNPLEEKLLNFRMWVYKVEGGFVWELRIEPVMERYVATYTPNSKILLVPILIPSAVLKDMRKIDLLNFKIAISYLESVKSLKGEVFKKNPVDIKKLEKVKSRVLRFIAKKRKDLKSFYDDLPDIKCSFEIDERVYRKEDIEMDHFIYSWVGLIGIGILVGLALVYEREERKKREKMETESKMGKEENDTIA